MRFPTPEVGLRRATCWPWLHAPSVVDSLAQMALGKKKSPRPRPRRQRETEFDDFANPLSGDDMATGDLTASDGDPAALESPEGDGSETEQDIRAAVRTGGVVKDLVALNEDSAQDLEVTSTRNDVTGRVRVHIKRRSDVLTCTVKQAYDLRPMDPHEKNDVYVEMTLQRDLVGQIDDKQKTSTIKNAGADARWDSHGASGYFMNFSLLATDKTEYSNTHLIVQAIDEDYSAGEVNDTIGESKIRLAEVLFDDDRGGGDFDIEHVFELQDSDFILSHFFVKLEHQASVRMPHTPLSNILG